MLSIKLKLHANLAICLSFFCIFNTINLNESNAQFSGARDYLNTPKNISTIDPYYNYYTGNESSKSDLSYEGSFHANSYTLYYQYAFSLFKNIASVQGYMGYEALSFSSSLDIKNDTGSYVKTTSRNLTGASDLTIYFTANIFGAPSMDTKKFNEYYDIHNAESNLSGRLFIVTPIGQYDKSTDVNIGANRWIFMPEFSFTQPIGERMYIALYSNIAFYTDNNEFLDTNKLAQDPELGLDFHPSYTIFQDLDSWISLDAMFRFSGTSYINGIDQSSASNTLMIGGTASSNFTENQSLSFQYLNTLTLGEKSPGIWQLYLSYYYTF